MINRDDQFPHERFVQQAIESYFTEQGFVIGKKGYADLVVERDDERWVIEAKGETQAVGLDFRTGLGQLLQAMDEEDARYALAVPDTSAFRRQMEATPRRVRTLLGLHFLVVGEDGSVEIRLPDDSKGDE